MQNEGKSSSTQALPSSKAAVHSALGRLTSAFTLWTSTQQRSLLILSVLLLIFLGVESRRKYAVLGDPAPLPSARADEIQDALDPNTADAAALSAIPNLGEKRAEQIVEYRIAFIHQHPGVSPFHTLNDLLRLKGFGLATVDNLRPFLVFPLASPSTAP